jgi:hypothetical protein
VVVRLARGARVASIRAVNVSLRIFGDDLDPEGVSALLGGEPSWGHSRGDAIDGDSLPAATGSWVLETSLPENAELEDHIAGMFAKLTGDIDEWATLTTRFSADVRCVLVAGSGREGFDLSPRLAQGLADRGVVISFVLLGD